MRSAPKWLCSHGLYSYYWNNKTAKSQELQLSFFISHKRLPNDMLMLLEGTTRFLWPIFIFWGTETGNQSGRYLEWKLLLFSPWAKPNLKKVAWNFCFKIMMGTWAKFNIVCSYFHLKIQNVEKQQHLHWPVSEKWKSSIKLNIFKWYRWTS